MASHNPIRAPTGSHLKSSAHTKVTLDRLWHLSGTPLSLCWGVGYLPSSQGERRQPQTLAFVLVIVQSDSDSN